MTLTVGTFNLNNLFRSLGNLAQGPRGAFCRVLDR
jgi:hypothetical protein